MDENNAQAIISAVERLARVEEVDLGNGAKAIAIPVSANGNPKKLLSIKSLIDEYRTAPERKTGTATLLSIESFIAHVNRMKDEGTAIFANTDRKNPSLLAVFDYHQLDGSPRFGKHRAHYAFPVSPEWEKWLSQNGEAMSQEDFAFWIEENIADLADPGVATARTVEILDKIQCELATPARLAELSRGLSVRVDQKVASHTKLSSGEAQIAFSAEHTDDAGVPLKVPGAFLVTIPLFRGGPLYAIPVRLRYRVQGGRVQWHYDLYRVDEIFDHAIETACNRVVEETTLPLFEGTPES